MAFAFKYNSESNLNPGFAEVDPKNDAAGFSTKNPLKKEKPL